MVFRKFYLGVIIRVFFILLCAIIISLTEFSSKYLHTIIVAFLLIAGLTISLIWYVNKTNRILSVFFNGLSVSYDDLKIIAYKNDSGFNSLIKNIQEAWELLKESRLEKEKDHHFLKHILSNIGNGIIAYRLDGEVLLANPAATEMFGFRELHNIAQFKRTNLNLADLLLDKESRPKSYLRIIAKESVLELVVYISCFKSGNDHIRLASFQNINEKLSQKEIDAWHGIIGVLSHEIMSSVSPITSLSDHLYIELNKGIKEEKDLLNDPEFAGDLVKGLKIIASRSSGIMDFVKKYRSVTTPLVPQFRNTDINSMIDAIIPLATKEFPRLKIVFIMHKLMNLELDQGLIEQCILNIIRNSWEAMGQKTSEQLDIFTLNSSSEFILVFKDYGKGIEKEIIDNIFIPFFTTKKNGSGIGLSFTRQVMLLHGGDVQVTSTIGKGTTVRLIFPLSVKR